MVTPLTLPTDYTLPTSGLIAVGVKGERPSFGVDVGDPGPPSWAQEMADERCKTCDGTGNRLHLATMHLAQMEYADCADCVDGKPSRSVRIECGNCKRTGLQEPHWANPQGVCRACDGEGFRTVGEAAVLAVVKVSSECLGHKPADHICDAWRDGDWVWHTSGAFDEHTEFPIHFPNAQDHDWAIIARMKETET